MDLSLMTYMEVRGFLNLGKIFSYAISILENQFNYYNM